MELNMEKQFEKLNGFSDYSGDSITVYGLVPHPILLPDQVKRMAGNKWLTQIKKKKDLEIPGD